MKAELYYEAHITIEPKEKNKFIQLAVDLGSSWRISLFDQDMVDDYHGKWFASYRGSDLEVTKAEVYLAVKALESKGYKILRWKIEDTILDSNYGDRLI